jgi:hypothetical protein
MVYSPLREDLTKRAWEQGIVGIWFGAWKLQDLNAVQGHNPKDAAEILSNLPAQRALKEPIKQVYVHTSRRFQNIDKHDWVFVYYDNAIHLGQLTSPISAQPVKEFERNGELFKARRISHCKLFRLDDLPDSFRLLACAGRSTVHQVHGAELLIQMLAESESAEEVTQKFRRLDWGDWLNALGPKGWESLCLAYLILEKGYLPTGLGVGNTLPDFDIVGRGLDGRILAQCKKSPGVHSLSEKERAAYDNNRHANLFLFAYGGAQNVPPNLQVLNREDLKKWFDTSKNGIEYRKRLKRDK